MNETSAPPIEPPKPAPIAATKPGPGIAFQKSPVRLQPNKAKISKTAHKGLIADVVASLQASDAPDALKAAMAAELTASGAKAASLDLHRHELAAAAGKTVHIHATIKPLF